MICASSSNPSQSPDNSFDLPCEEAESGNEFETFGRCSVPELYLEGRVSVVLDLAVKRNFDVAGERSSERQSEAIDFPIFLLQFHTVDRQDIQDRDEQMVFVLNVEPVNRPNVRVASVVRFHAVYQQLEEVGTGAYFSCLRKGRFQMLPIISDNEFGSVRVESGGAYSLNRVAIGDVKSASDIVDCVANHQRELRANVLLSKPVIEELFPRIRLNVKRQVISVLRGKESLLNIRDVLIGPLKFEPGPFESARHTQNGSNERPSSL